MKNAPNIGAVPPIAARQRQTHSVHNATLIDDYAWLRDANWREAMHDPNRLAPEIHSYLDAENAYTEACMGSSHDFRKALAAEMRGRINERDASVPLPDGEWVYYTRFRAAGEHPIICRAPRATPNSAGRDTEQILLDGDAEAAHHDYFNLGGADHSPDHRHLAFGVDTRGSEAFAIHVRHIESGAPIGAPIENTTGAVEWSGDGQTLFYITLDADHRPNAVWRLPLGANPTTATCVYREADPGFFVGLGATQSGRYILINAHDHATSEVHFIPADDPAHAPCVIATRETGVEYEIEHAGDDFIILTNVDGADDFCLMRAPVRTCARVHWQPLVEHEPGRLILDIVEFADYRIRLERVDALPRIVCTDKHSGADHPITFDGQAYSLGIDPGLEYATRTLRLVYSAPDTPTETYDYDLATGRRTLKKRRTVPSGFDGGDYVVRRLTAATADDEAVPITLMHHVDTPIDGTAACVLQGYGAYGISEAAAFSTHRLSLVDRGVVYAIAHVRGGRERGQAWYKAGKLGHKPNTFTDFIACAEHLIATSYTRASRIAPFGGSAGGMLVGAVINQRPALFGAAVADVPFVDVLNTMLDASLPLTPPEWPEWGNPRDDATAFDTIAGYCPYQNVTAQAYPPLIVIAGVSDPRVTYWEPAKWVAKLRATKTDDNILLLKTHMGAGHGGLPGRFAALDEIALLYAFLLIELGVVGTNGAPIVHRADGGVY